MVGMNVHHAENTFKLVICGIYNKMAMMALDRSPELRFAMKVMASVD